MGGKRFAYTCLEQRKMLYYLSQELKRGNKAATKKAPDVWRKYCRTYTTLKTPAGLESHLRKSILPQIEKFCTFISKIDYFLLLKKLKIELDVFQVKEIEKCLNCKIILDDSGVFLRSINQDVNEISVEFPVPLTREEVSNVELDELANNTAIDNLNITSNETLNTTVNETKNTTKNENEILTKKHDKKTYLNMVNSHNTTEDLFKDLSSDSEDGLITNTPNKLLNNNLQNTYTNLNCLSAAERQSISKNSKHNMRLSIVTAPTISIEPTFKNFPNMSSENTINLINSISANGDLIKELLNQINTIPLAASSPIKKNISTSSIIVDKSVSLLQNEKSPISKPSKKRNIVHFADENNEINLCQDEKTKITKRIVSILNYNEQTITQQLNDLFNNTCFSENSNDIKNAKIKATICGLKWLMED